MIKRIIEISQAKTYLSISMGQLVVKREGNEIGRIPCEDIGVLLVDHSGVIYTHSVFTELLRHGAAVVLCNDTHHPTGMLLPIESHTTQSEMFRHQINAKLPVKKKLWQQVIRSKINHQATLVTDSTQTYKALMDLRKKVRSGDPDNIEAQAARKFWPAYIQNEKFSRQRDGVPPNNLLNYGYMVLRAAVARAICSAGLLPTLGIHHHNRYNAYCLADDMIEPFRGFVEEKVRDIYTENSDIDQLDQNLKAQILKVLYHQISIAGKKGPLMVALHRSMASLSKCLAGTEQKLLLPDHD